MADSPQPNLYAWAQGKTWRLLGPCSIKKGGSPLDDRRGLSVGRRRLGGMLQSKRPSVRGDGLASWEERGKGSSESEGHQWGQEAPKIVYQRKQAWERVGKG
jgi:hypothetical protein